MISEILSLKKMESDISILNQITLLYKLEQLHTSVHSEKFSQQNRFSQPIPQPFNYRTHASNNRGYYYFFILSHVGFSLMFGGIPLKSRGY